MEDENSYRECPSCAGQNAKLKDTKNDFRIRQCFDCGTLFSNRLPDDNESEDYDSYHCVANLEVPKFIYWKWQDLFNGFYSQRKRNKFEVLKYIQMPRPPLQFHHVVAGYIGFDVFRGDN